MSLKVENISTHSLMIAFCILNIISSVLSSCELGIPQDTSLKPYFFKWIGSRKFEFIPNNSDNRVELFDNQEVDVMCNIKFSHPIGYDEQNYLKVKCENNNLEINGNYEGNFLHFVCSSQRWNLYETNKNFDWCPSNVTSYLLTRPKVVKRTKLEYLAGVCYDTLNLSFKSLYYKLAPPRSQNLNPAKLANGDYEPSLEINYINETFEPKSIKTTDYDNEDVQQWMKYAKYNYSSIIQNSLLLSEFNDELGSLVDLAWWPNLRLGNWQRYETALTKHVQHQNQSYNILAGVSDFAKVPVIESCQSNYTLNEITDYRNQKIPLYIWNYLQSTNNSSDEIVIIGVNSPFYQFYADTDIVFCTDICHEIPWLKKISSTFRYSALGAIFCCSSQEVKSSNRLDGFNEIDFNSQNTVDTSTAESLLFTTVEYTTVDDGIY